MMIILLKCNTVNSVNSDNNNVDQHHGCNQLVCMFAMSTMCGSRLI